MHKEIFIPIGVVALSIAFLDPFMYHMTPSLTYILLALLFLISLLYALFIWRERPQDEREHAHRAFSGMIAYLTGVAVLVTGIIYQVLYIHSVDTFLVATLAGMTIAKYVAFKHVQEQN